MTRFHLGFLFIVLYIGWVSYRWIIKKDIKQHKDEFRLYTILVGAWAVIYFCFFYNEINHFIGVISN